MTLLGVNIDHVATVRQARKEGHPDPIAAAREAVRAGAAGITAHLREDRRHIQDDDIRRLKTELSVPLNLEMAASADILKIAEEVRPAWACLVPEKRQELTTEGGLDVVANETKLKGVIDRLHAAGTKVSLFIDAAPEAIAVSRRLAADAVEIHTGVYARHWKTGARAELDRILIAAKAARDAGLLVNAGHGLDYENVGDLMKAFAFHEFNIGFAIVSRAITVGLYEAVREMRDCMSAVPAVKKS